MCFKASCFTRKGSRVDSRAMEVIGAQNGHFMEFTVLGPLPWVFTVVNTWVYGRKLMFVHFSCVLVVLG